MKRLLLLLLAYAVGGAIINVAVAWGCAEWAPRTTWNINGDTSVQARIGATDSERLFQHGGGEILGTRAGLPLRSLSFSPDVLRPPPRRDRSAALFASNPIWPGFAINTIFYAAILCLLFAAPGFVRRRIRARRGQCPACAYPVGQSPICTECGKPVTPRA